jgi:hypothetical protein
MWAYAVAAVNAQPQLSQNFAVAGEYFPQFRQSAGEGP